MSNIKVQCIDQAIGFLNTPVISSGNVNYDTITFEFCSKWDGFTKTAIFYRTKDEVYYQILDESNTCNIPNEVLGEKGVIYIGVFGSSGDTTITSQVLKYRIDEGAITEDLRPTDPTPDIYDQIIALCSQIRKEQTDFITAWEKTIQDTRDELIEEVEKIIENEGIGDAETLGGQLPEYYATAQSVEDLETFVEKSISESLEAIKDGTTVVGKAKDADTVDGLHASRFVQNVVMSGYNKTDDPNTTELSRIRTTHANCPTANVPYIIDTTFIDSTADIYERRQTAYGTGGNNTVFERAKTYNGSWTPWKKVAYADEVLPLTGGTLSGELKLNNGLGRFSANESSTNMYAYTPDKAEEKRRWLNLYNTNYKPNIGEALCLGYLENGTLKTSTVLHTGNSSPVVPTNVDPGVGASVTYADGTVIFVYEEG